MYAFKNLTNKHVTEINSFKVSFHNLSQFECHSKDEVITVQNVCCRVNYTVFAMRNQSTMVNSKNIQILYNCFTLQCMTQQSI